MAHDYETCLYCGRPDENWNPDCPGRPDAALVADWFDEDSSSLLRGEMQSIHWDRYGNSDYSYTEELRIAAADRLIDDAEDSRCGVAYSVIKLRLEAAMAE